MTREDFETNDEAGAASFYQRSSRDTGPYEDPTLADEYEGSRSHDAAVARRFNALPVEERRAMGERIRAERIAFLARMDAAADARHDARRARHE